MSSATFSEQVGALEPIAYAIFIAVGAAVGVMVIWLFWYRRYIAQWGTIPKIRLTVSMIKYLVTFEMFVILPLIYYCIVYGPPITINVVTSYGNGDSWIYGYGRPVLGIILIGVGSFSDMHFICRFVCLIGCILQISFDSISATQVYSYKQSVSSNSAPTGTYSITAFDFYIWRDVVSIGICTLIWLFITYLLTMLGWGHQRVPFWQIVGGPMDRPTVMRLQLNKKMDDMDDEFENDQSKPFRQRTAAY